MKKHVMFLAAATSLALASCSNDHDVELNHGSEICFRTAFEMPHHGGRATEYNNGTDVGDIVVSAKDQFGDFYFKEQIFTKLEGANAYTSSEKYYWPGDGSELTFTAVKVDQKAKFGTAYSPNAVWDNQEDLVYCFGAKGSKANQETGVELRFNHALTQIVIEAKNDNHKNYIVEVVNAKIGRVGSTATFTIGTDAASTGWSAITNTASYTSTDLPENGFITLGANAVQITGKIAENKSAGSAMILPQDVTAWNKKSFDGAGAEGSGSYIGLKLRIRTAGGSWVYPAKVKDAENLKQEFAWVAVPIPNIKWLPGTKYTYTLDFSNGAGFTDPENPEPKLVLDKEVKLDVKAENWSTGETVALPGTTTPAAARRK